MTEPLGYVVAYPDGTPIFYHQGSIFWKTYAEAQEASKFNLGAGNPVAVFNKSTEREVLEEFVGAMNVLSMRPRLSTWEIAEILNPIGDSAREVLKTPKISNDKWICLECLASNPFTHKMDCSNLNKNKAEELKSYYKIHPYSAKTAAWGTINGIFNET